MSIERITLATTDMTAMVEFYNTVFGSGLEPIDSPDSFHLGSLCGISLLMCPNEIADVDARQNRHQFKISVPDMDTALDAVMDAGGVVITDGIQNDRRVAGISDPDGNTYELTTG